MSVHAFDVNVADFAAKVLRASEEKLVLVDFWADWCAPCRALKPILEKLAGEYGGRFLLAKVNSDDNQELAAHYGVRGIPNVKAFLGGDLVDEFSGALPEAQVRAFIDSLIPSPAEPLRLAAQEARAQGDGGAARRLLQQALQLDPAHEASRLDLAEASLDDEALDEARRLLAEISEKARQGGRAQALQARLDLAASGSGDIAALQAKVAAQPQDLDARLAYGNALALRREYRAALAQLLEIVRIDRGWQDQAGRKAMLRLFTFLADDPAQADLVREFRIALARTLN